MNPATGKQQLSLVSRTQEIQMGRQAAQSVAATIGVVDAPKLTAYVDSVGRDLASRSERPDLPWTFRIVDDPSVNAFALPGGFIYVTRGILANFESEAEMAGVLGHEIGHVTARHSVHQMSRQQLQQLGLGIGMVLSSDVRKVGGLLSAGLDVLNLKYSRDDETQADELGVRYVTRAGYDANAMIGVMKMLEALPGSSRQVPEWQQTHPLPANRETHLRQVIDTTEGAARGRTGPAAYLDHLAESHLVYGSDPREGYFKGSTFYDPGLAFQIRFPTGWKTQNSAAQVAAVSSDQSAALVLQPDSAASPTAGLQAFLSRQGVTGGAVDSSPVNGISAARAPFSAQTSDGEVRGMAMFLSYKGAVYGFLGFTPSAGWSGYADAVSAAMSSFAPLTDPAILDVQPNRLEVVTVPAAMSLATFQSGHPSPVPLEELARINRLAPDATVPAGTRLKWVVGKPLP